MVCGGSAGGGGGGMGSATGNHHRYCCPRPAPHACSCRSWTVPRCPQPAGGGPRQGLRAGAPSCAASAQPRSGRRFLNPRPPDTAMRWANSEGLTRRASEDHAPCLGRIVTFFPGSWNATAAAWLCSNSSAMCSDSERSCMLSFWPTGGRKGPCWHRFSCCSARHFPPATAPTPTATSAAGCS